MLFRKTYNYIKKWYDSNNKKDVKSNIIHIDISVLK